MSVNIVLSLISHTNIGKTTLSRTLLRRDIGEVRDAAHVTDQSEKFVLVQGENEALILWDTPGFGNVHALLKRLKQEGGALGWLMHEVVDRVFDRPLFCSLAAARNVRTEADVVLYLVNVQEKPEDAGYVARELALLEALGKPVLMILNQLRREECGEAEDAELERRWRAYFKQFSCLKQVITLDAFSRSWRHELRLIDEIILLVPQEKQHALRSLRARFIAQWEDIFRDCSDMAAQTLWFAAHQCLNSASEKDPDVLFRKLVAGLQSHLDRYLEVLMTKHGLEAEGRALLKTDIKAVNGLAAKPLQEKKTGLMAGAMASAGSGLMADILSGGLTFGGGALLGFLGGYLGGVSYARLLNLRGGRGMVTWNRQALSHLFMLLLSYYLLAAIHGRGRGRLELDKPVAFLWDAIENRWEVLDGEVNRLIEEIVKSSSQQPDRVILDRFHKLFAQASGGIMDQIFH